MFTTLKSFTLVPQEVHSQYTNYEELSAVYYYSNNEAKFEFVNDKYNYFGDSIDIAFKVLGLKMHTKTKDIKIVKQIPYESENKYSGVFFEENNKTYCTVKGSLEKILEFSSKMRVDGKDIELNKEQIKEVINKTPAELETEIFVHGAICFGYSGRCFLSDFLASRSANLGDCAQSCRWAYNLYLEEKNKPGNLMPVQQDENGTYILSSKDLCLIKEIPEIVEMGIDSLKIEGRLKTEYYLATVIGTYRNAIDDYIKSPKNYDYTKYLKELEKTKTRGLTTFYFNDKNNKDFQEYEGKQYNPDYEFGGKILEIHDDKKTLIEIRNRLQIGDTLEILIPNKLEPFEFKIEEMWDSETGEEIDHVNPGKEGQSVILRLPIDVEKGWILRRKK